MAIRNIPQVRGTPRKVGANGRLPQLRSEKQVIALAMPNTRLVTFLAKRYLGQGLKLDDLISAGYDGLLRAAELHDPKKGKFSYYASIQIRAAIQQAIKSKGREIRNSVPVERAIRSMKLTERYLTQKYRRSPADFEIAEFLEITEEELAFLRQRSYAAYSLEEPSNGNGKGYRDGSSPNPLSLTIQAEMERRIGGALDTLPIREARALRLFFGLGRGGEMTYGEVASIMAEIEGRETFSREYIRQIVENALETIRIKFPKLRDHLEHNATKRFNRKERSLYLQRPGGLEDPINREILL